MRVSIESEMHFLQYRATSKKIPLPTLSIAKHNFRDAKYHNVLKVTLFRNSILGISSHYRYIDFHLRPEREIQTPVIRGQELVGDLLPRKLP